MQRWRQAWDVPEVCGGYKGGWDGVTHLTLQQARALGIIPAREARQIRAPRLKLNQVQWDAKIIPGGVWMQIPFVPPSLNIWKNWHWTKQNRYKHDLYDAIWKLATAMKLPKFERATVQIIYYHATNRRRDPADNYAPKFLMDALVRGGILVDDNGDLVTVMPVGMAFDRERPRTEVFIWGME